MTTIKAGYQVQIASWENDLDHQRTKSIDGLSEGTAKFYCEFAGLFKKSHHEPGGIAGNAYSDSDVKWPELTAAVKALTEKYPLALAEIWEGDGIDFTDEDAIHDSIIELAYEAFGSSEFMFRKCNGIDVFFFPEDIRSIDLTF